MKIWLQKTGAKNGFHIEHILSRNEESQKHFEDEDTFLVERNRLGGILLLKGKDNISSSNEVYQQKIKKLILALCFGMRH